MKFYCDACHTKYAISDDKVRGKVLRIRCKKCGNIITVREHRAPVADAVERPSPPPQPKESATDQIPTTHWYYALNGETFGPFTLAVLREKYATAALSDATYVWHDTLDSWKPVATVPAFAGALTQGQKIRPRMQTLGFSGKLEAIKVEDGPSKQRKGAVPAGASRNQEAAQAVRTAEAPRPEPTPTVEEPRPSRQAQEPQRQTPSRPAHVHTPARPSSTTPTSPQSSPQSSPQPKPQATPPPRPVAKTTQPPPRPDLARSRTLSSPGSVPTPEARPLQDARKDKLDRLRDRLTLDSGSPTPAITADSRPAETEANEDAAIDHAGPTIADAPQPSGDVDALPQPVSGGAMLTFAPGVTKSGDSGLHEPSDDAINFELPPRVGASARAKPSPSSTSDILERIVDEPSSPSEHVDTPTDSGIVPIFPTTPGSTPRIDPSALPTNTSESVLIELKSLQKEGRGKRGVMIGGAIAAVVLILGAGVTAAIFAGGDDEIVATKPTVGPPAEHRDELVQRTYSKDEIDKFQTMQLEDGLLFDEEEVVGETEAETEAVVAAVQDEPVLTERTTEGAKKPQGKKPQKPAIVVKEEPRKVATKPKQDATAEEEQEPPVEPEKKPTEEELVNSLLKPRKEMAVVRPEDKLAAKSSQKAGLTKEQAVVGFRDIKGSVRTCRDSHNRRSAPLNVGKIKVTVTVQPEGNVSGFEIHSDKVKHTEFDRCMESRRKRWKFPGFTGDPVVIQTSIIL